MKIKQLFLGGGAEGRINKLDRMFVSSLLRTESPKILYIHVAHHLITINNFTYTPESLYGWARGYFSKLGIEKVDLCKDLIDMTIERIGIYGALYIGGGNTFDLMHKMRQSGFDRVLKEYINNGGIVYGSSAGAIILGKNISVARLFGEDKDVNQIGLVNMDGINMIGGKSVVCHYSKKEDQSIMDYAKTDNTDIITLPFETGVLFHGNHMQVVGKYPAYLFNNLGKVKLDN